MCRNLVIILLQEFIPTCPDSSFSYIIPSPVQCDLYYLCEFGTASRRFVSHLNQENRTWERNMLELINSVLDLSMFSLDTLKKKFSRIWIRHFRMDWIRIRILYSSRKQTSPLVHVSHYKSIGGLQNSLPKKYVPGRYS